MFPYFSLTIKAQNQFHSAVAEPNLSTSHPSTARARGPGNGKRPQMPGMPGGPGPGFEPGRQAPQAYRLPGYLTPTTFCVLKVITAPTNLLRQQKFPEIKRFQSNIRNPRYYYRVGLRP